MAINFGILNPNIPLAAGRTADLGKAMSTAEAIIGAKNRNKLLEMQMAEFPANAPVRELARVQAQNELDRIESGQLTPEQMEENRKLLGNLTLTYRALAGSDNRKAFADVLASVGDRGNGPFSKMIQIAQAGVQEAMQTGDWSRVDAQSEQIMGMLQSLRAEGGNKYSFGSQSKATAVINGKEVPVMVGTVGNYGDGTMQYKVLGPGGEIDPATIEDLKFVNAGGANAFDLERTRQGNRIEMAEVQTQEELERAREAAQIDTDQGHIDRAFPAADSVAVLSRGLELLDSVETGGVTNQWRIRAKQAFGIETADEGELQANLGKAVLSQLRETFGAQFTEREGARLESIEAGLGKNNLTNKRLLAQAKSMMERIAKRGIRAAERQLNFAAADDLRDALEFSLNPVDAPDSQPQSAPGEQESIEDIIKRNQG